MSKCYFLLYFIVTAHNLSSFYLSLTPRCFNRGTNYKLNFLNMKPTSLKVKMQSIAQDEMQNMMGGSNSSEKLKTVVVTGKKKNSSMMTF